MTKQELFRLFGISDIMNLPDAVMKVLEGQPESRNEIFNELLRLNEYDLTFDWFQAIYEEELSQRKQSKQDFTPASVGLLAAMLCGTGQRSTYEPTAGNGSMLIEDWAVKTQTCFPWEYFPSQNQFECWELSDRAIPILLLNLSIRGMMGTVYHGDVLEKSIKQKYILLNRHDDALAFSEIHKVGNYTTIVKI